MIEENIITDLSVIADRAVEIEDANSDFYMFLISEERPDIDDKVQQIYSKVEAAVDCTTCGNCCQSLIINVTEDEVSSLATVLKKSPAEIKDKYIEESMQGQLIMNTIPCAFLKEKKCSIYEHRFTECRDFPHLHKPGFIRRYSGTVMHYGSCPIIYNVIELLKQELKYDTKLTAL